MTDPMRGAKAPLGETRDGSNQQRSDAKSARGEVPAEFEKPIQHRDDDGKVATSSDSKVSSQNEPSKKRKRWKKRPRRKSDATSSGSTSGSTNNNAEPIGETSEQASVAKTQDERDGQNHQSDKQKHFKQPHKPLHNHNGKKRFNRHNKQNPNQQPLYAALDLGTNNCRLLVAKPMKAGQFRVVDAFSRIVRLGEGLAATGKLSEGAMERAVGALKICASKLARHNIKNYRLIATEACRQATNGEAFLARVKKETGLDLEIINRETEARLAVSGCASLVDRETQSVILFDIGGGSSEIAAIQFDERRTQRLANHIKSWTSLPVGVVTLSERHGGKDVTQQVFDAMVDEVDKLIETTAPQNMLDFSPNIDTFHLLGTSGTVTTLAGLHLNLPRYDRRRVDGLWLQDADVDKMLNQLLSWDIETRSANPCIGPDRSDLVLAGCAIMQSIRKRWPSNKMRVADRGLREGLLNDMMAKDGVWRRRRRRRNSHNGQNQTDQSNTAQTNTPSEANSSHVNSGKHNE